MTLYFTPEIFRSKQRSYNAASYALIAPENRYLRAANTKARSIYNAPEGGNGNILTRKTCETPRQARDRLCYLKLS